MQQQRKSKAPVINQRYKSKAQVERFKRAAKLRRLSLNGFMLEAGEKLAAQTLETGRSGSEQLISEKEPLSLNQ